MKTKVIFFADENGRAPVLDWLESLPENMKIKALALLGILKQRGNTLRRPLADYLQDGIYELRWSGQRVNYRILYFFHGRGIAVLAAGLTKESNIPERDLQLALRRKGLFEKNPQQHSWSEI